MRRGEAVRPSFKSTTPLPSTSIAFQRSTCVASMPMMERYAKNHERFPSAVVSGRNGFCCASALSGTPSVEGGSRSLPWHSAFHSSRERSSGSGESVPVGNQGRQSRRQSSWLIFDGCRSPRSFIKASTLACTSSTSMSVGTTAREASVASSCVNLRKHRCHPKMQNTGCGDPQEGAQEGGQGCCTCLCSLCTSALASTGSWARVWC